MEEPQISRILGRLRACYRTPDRQCVFTTKRTVQARSAKPSTAKNRKGHKGFGMGGCGTELHRTGQTSKLPSFQTSTERTTERSE